MGSDGSPFEYPEREPFFAFKFLRLVMATHAAKEIGCDGCWLLTILALAEDALHYSGPTRFWNDELISALGFQSRKQLIATRDKVIAAGWLQYGRKGTRSVGLYAVQIPEQYATVPARFPLVECTAGETNPPTVVSRTVHEQVQESDKSGYKNGAQRGTPSIPPPVPNPNPKERSYLFPERYKSPEVDSAFELYRKHWESINHVSLEQYRLEAILMEAARLQFDAAKLVRWMAKCVLSGRYVNVFDPDDIRAADVPKPAAEELPRRMAPPRRPVGKVNLPPPPDKPKVKIATGT